MPVCTGVKSVAVTYQEIAFIYTGHAGGWEGGERGGGQGPYV